MTATAGGLPVPTLWPFDWRRLSGWFRAAWELLTFSHGTGAAGTTSRQSAGADLQLEELMVEHAEAAYRVALSVTRNQHLAALRS